VESQEKRLPFNNPKKKTESMWDNLIGDEYPKELLDEVKMHLKGYRSM